MRGESLTFLGAHEGQVADPVIEAEFSTIYFPFPAFFSEIYLDPTHSGYQYTHP